MKATFSAAALALSALTLAPAVDAAQTTTTFQVKLVVQASCSFKTNPIADIDLGSRATNATNIEGSTTMRVQCTNGATPSIKLTSTNNWNLKDAAGAGVAYRLLGSNNQEWSDINPRTYVSDGSEQVFDIKGKVDNVGNKAGTFKDTVTVAVDF